MIDDKEQSSAEQATDATNDQASNTTGAPAGMLGGQPYQPTDADRRRDALYIAQNTTGGAHISADELIKKAKAIRAYIESGE